MSAKDTILRVSEFEAGITERAMKAFPEGKMEFTPHEKSRTAGDLLSGFIMIEKAITMGLDGSIDFTHIMKAEKPQTVEAMVVSFKEAHATLVEKLKATDDSVLDNKIDFIPGQEMTISEFIWFMIFDGVHHRGQLSVYIRMAGGLVPSIYGPSADDDGGMKTPQE